MCIFHKKKNRAILNSFASTHFFSATFSVFRKYKTKHRIALLWQCKINF